ncbi:hypothetical protein ACFYTQ_36650 [Nocardia sp. NPDC004068]|uniref:hypothetical protein n=1 Tax=Nocardia sp. NPDC004068 TaxID=3364303 RepID=UPI0036B34F31
MTSTPSPTDQSTAEAIDTLRALVDAQNLRQAKRELRQLQQGIDDHTWLIISEIADTLRYKTHAAALAKLRKLWQQHETHRALIEACVPKPQERQYIPARMVERRPARRETHPPPGSQIEAYEDKLAKDERDDPGTPRPELIVDKHDYDEDALPTAQEQLCVSCRIERSAADRWTDRNRNGRGDDGLCGECRSTGRPGVPELPLGHTRQQAVEARLEFLAETFETTSRGIFRQEWRHSDPQARAVIERWVRTHTTPEPSSHSQPHQVPELNGECAKCGDWRQLRDSLCVDCHPGFGGQNTPAGSVLPEPKTEAPEPRSKIRAVSPVSSSPPIRPGRRTAGDEPVGAVAREAPSDGPAVSTGARRQMMRRKAPAPGRSQRLR